MKKAILVLLVILLMLIAGCSSLPDKLETSPIGQFHYYYDEAHDVSIWTWKSGYGAGMAVLPGKDVQNPFEPIRFGTGQ